jgi:hypothetical protein
MTYAICFQFPEGRVFAGDYKDGLGYSSTLRGALLFDDANAALRMLQNGYGEEALRWARIVTVESGGAVA